MSSDTTQSSTPEGEPAAVATDEAGTLGHGRPHRDHRRRRDRAAEPIHPDPARPRRLRLGDGQDRDAAADGPPDDGETVPCTGPEADQALILGPPDGQDGTTAPAVVQQSPGAVDAASLFHGWAVLWSGNPSEAGDAGLAPSQGAVCLCGETGLAAGEGIADLAS